MDIQQFAENHRLKVRKDDCSDPIIDGRHIFTLNRRNYGHHIFDNGDGRLGICLMFEDDNPKMWGFAKRKGEAAGLLTRQDGRSEGTMLFDPANATQARTAIRLTGARVKRKLSVEQHNTLVMRLSKARQARNK